MNKLFTLRTLCLFALSLWAAPHVHAQNLTVSPTSVWIGGTVQATLKAIAWTDWLTGQTVSPDNVPPATSGYYTFPGFSAGGLTCTTNLYWPVPSEIQMTLYTSESGEYHVVSGSEDITVTVVDLADMQKDVSDPIKIGTTVTFTLATLPAGTPEPSSLLWYGDATGSGLTGTSTWTNGGNKTVFAMSDCPSELGFVYKQMSVDVFELIGLTVDNEYPDVGEAATWTATLIPYDRGDVVDWSTNGIPTGGNGLTYARSFSKEEYGATFTAKATCGSSTFDKIIWLERVEIVFTNATTAQFVGGPVWDLSLTNSSTEVTWQIFKPSGVEYKSGTSITVEPGGDPSRITLLVYPDRIASRNDSKDLFAVRITVDQASLVDNGTFAKVQNDADETEYPEPYWTAAMPVNQPVSPVQYQRDTRIKVDAKFLVEPSDWSGNVKVKANGGYALEVQDFGAAAGELSAVGVQAEAGAKLPNKVDRQENFEEEWLCSVDEGTHYGNAKKSRHATYVTLKKPVAFQHTVVHLACKTTGATNEHEAIMNAWKSFEGASTKTWDGYEMSYWKYGDSGSFDYKQLVKTIDGKCQQWQGLLLATFAVNKAIGAEGTAIIPFQPDPVAAPIAPGTRPNAFLIEPTLRGQNNNTPSYFFNAHAIVMYTHAGVHYLMDPSYGKKLEGASRPALEIQWEDDSVWQYYWGPGLYAAGVAALDNKSQKGCIFDP